MKVIQSSGGPLIGIDCNLAYLWSANTGKSFIGSDARFNDDYDAIGHLPDGTLMPPWSIMLLQGRRAQALAISMPFETAIIQSDSSSVLLAQVQYADPEWSFLSVTMRDFEIATFHEEVSFRSTASTYMLFDSAYLPSEVKSDCLQFELSEGDYLFSAGFRQPDDQTSLLLYRIIRRT